MDSDELPLAPPSYEEDLVDGFRRGYSVEEFAARCGHEFAQFPHNRYRYREPGLTAWVQELARFFFQKDLQKALREAREKYLDPAEIERVEAVERNPF